MSQRFVEGSGSKAKRFRRFLEFTQEVFCLRLCVRNLLPFFLLLCFNEPFQAFSCFKSLSPFRVLTANGQYMDVACGDTVYIVDPILYHIVRVVSSTNSVMIHTAFDAAVGHSLLAFQRFGPT